MRVRPLTPPHRLWCDSYNWRFEQNLRWALNRALLSPLDWAKLFPARAQAAPQESQWEVVPDMSSSLAPALMAGEQTWARGGQGLAARPWQCPRVCQQQAVCRPRSGMPTALPAPVALCRSSGLLAKTPRTHAGVPACFRRACCGDYLNLLFAPCMLPWQSFYSSPPRPSARLPAGTGRLRPCRPLDCCFAQHQSRTRQRCRRLATAWRVAASDAAGDSPESPTRGSARRAPQGLGQVNVFSLRIHIASQVSKCCSRLSQASAVLIQSY